MKITTCAYSLIERHFKWSFRFGQVKSDKRDVFSRSCRRRWRDCSADCQIPPLSWSSVLWSTSVSRPVSWDLNKEGHSMCSDKAFCCSRYVPPSPLLSPWTPSPPPTPLFLCSFSSSSIIPPTRPPLHCCFPLPFFSHCQPCLFIFPLRS